MEQSHNTESVPGFPPFVFNTNTLTHFFSFLSILDTFFFLSNAHNSVFIFSLMVPFNIEVFLLISLVVIVRESLFCLLVTSKICIFKMIFIIICQFKSM